MLVLSRKTDERIVIGEEIEVQVISVQGNRVRLGITCPDHVRILRSEVLQATLSSDANLQAESIAS